MKKTARSLMALVLALTLSLSLAGCSIGLDDMLIVKRAYKQVSEMDSLSFTVKAELEGTAGSLPVKLSADADCQCVIEPTTLKAQLALDLGKLGKFSLPLYVFSRDNALQVLAGLGRSGSTVWVSNSIPYAEKEDEDNQTANKLTVEEVLNMLQDDPEALSVGESESINGVSCRPFKLKIPGAVLMEALDLKVPQGSSAAVADTLVTVWIAEKDGVPMRLSGDLASLCQYILDVANADYLPKMKLKRMPVTVDITGYNNVESITLPTA